MAEIKNIYADIAQRTGGDIYIGVVGPVRTGKSTFIKKFMENSILPQIQSEAEKLRANDEMPQSGSGKQVMTTEPKFIPEKAVEITLGNNVNMRVKLIDCVGFLVNGASGTSDEFGPRMVNTPWSKEPMEFETAAEIGTKKVISDHSTIGIVVTCDGTIGDIPRENYVEAEEKVISEVKDSKKPFVILLNSKIPKSEETRDLAEHLSFKYSAKVIPVSCAELDADDIEKIIESIVLEFPVKEVRLSVPDWLINLESDNSIGSEFSEIIGTSFSDLEKMDDLFHSENLFPENRIVLGHNISKSDFGKGSVSLELMIDKNLFYQILAEKCGTVISSEEEIIREMESLSQIKEKYEKISSALSDAEEKGYGIVVPGIEDLVLEEPEIVKKLGSFGVKLKATAPSLHIIKAPITAEISPIVGSERQSEDMVKFLLEEFKEDPQKIWESNMFGKSLFELVNESLNAKLGNMPEDAREKIGETLKRIVNEGSAGLICIIL